MDEPGGCRTTPTHPRSIPSLFPLPEAEFSWALDLLRDSAFRCPPQPPSMLGGGCRAPCGPASFWGSGTRDPSALIGSSPPGIILTMCHSFPPEQSSGNWGPWDLNLFELTHPGLTQPSSGALPGREAGSAWQHCGSPIVVKTEMRVTLPSLLLAGVEKSLSCQ